MGFQYVKYNDWLPLNERNVMQVKYDELFTLMYLPEPIPELTQ